jgi:ABC-2 type transport system permease protein
MNSVQKYWAVFVISVRNQWAYVTELFIQSIFLLIIMYIFANLWSTTFQATGQSRFNGYDARSVVWYLAVTEAIVMGTPRLIGTLSEEIKQGDIAYRLIRPLNYVLYNYAQFLAEACVRIGVNLTAAGLVAFASFGLPAVSVASVGLFVVVSVLALTVQFIMNMVICLLLFWIEDGRGLDLILSRLVMILGGMMIPLPLFPHWLEQICLWLPFQAVAYLPAHTLVALSPADVARDISVALAWTVVLALVCYILYRKGVRQLHVQGG